MTRVDPRLPCIIGVAQRTWHLGGDELAPEPLAMQAEVIGAAAADAGAAPGSDVLGAIDSLSVVHCMTWPYDDPVGRLADQLGIVPAHRQYSGIGGTVPQQLVSSAAERILAGDLGVAVVVGAEALDTVRRLKKAGERPAWSHRHPERPAFPYEAPFHPAEVAHGVFQAWLTFAVRDVARRAHLGTSPVQDRAELGALLAPMTEVAAANPNAWFPVARTASELVEVTPENRMVGYPYTKRTVAIMDVDMAASVIIASHAEADRLGVPADRRVYLRGWSDALDATYLAEHPDLWRSPAMAWAAGEALRRAGLGVDDVAHLDLYSCFGSSIRFGQDALGLAQGDPRGVTVTGGLPFAGGPASNYLGHSIATMVQRLRADPGAAGLVSGVGMHMTKHAFGIYSTEPQPPSAPGGAPTPVLRPVIDITDGPAEVVGYSVVHDRSGVPEWGLVVGETADGSRCYGRVEDGTVLDEMERQEWVGRTVRFGRGDSAMAGPGSVNLVVDEATAG